MDGRSCCDVIHWFGREKSAKLLANTSSLCYELEGTDRHSREVVFNDSNE